MILCTGMTYDILSVASLDKQSITVQSWLCTCRHAIYSPLQFTPLLFSDFFPLTPYEFNTAIRTTLGKQQAVAGFAVDQTLCTSTAFPLFAHQAVDFSGRKHWSACKTLKTFHCLTKFTPSFRPYSCVCTVCAGANPLCCLDSHTPKQMHGAC